MSDGMGREPAYLSSHATNRYFIPNWGIQLGLFNFRSFLNIGMSHQMFADNFDKTCESKLLTVIEEPDTK